MRNKSRAFTLLELLVVIGLMAVLIALATTSYSTAQKKARDARRQSDLHQAQNVMEQCYSGSTNYQYPVITNSSGTLSGSCTINGTAYSFTITDPLNTGSYIYSIVSSTTTSYSISAISETIASQTYSVTNQQ